MKLEPEASISFSTEQALRLLAEGEAREALYHLNVCLERNGAGDEDDDVAASTGNGNHPDGKKGSRDRSYSGSGTEDGVPPIDEASLREKRCLVNMKLHNFDEVLNDARKILDSSADYSLAYKCLLVALCKTNRLEQVKDILRLWEAFSPVDADMLECRTKITALLEAVKAGIEPARAFSQLESQLGLSYDWLLARKPKDPRWKYRPVPSGQQAFVFCMHYKYAQCSLGAKCPDAHGKEEMAEWEARVNMRNVLAQLDSLNMSSRDLYIKNILKSIADAGDLRLVATEVLPDELKIRSSKPLDRVTHISSSSASKSSKLKWTLAVESKKPLTHICLLFDHNRDSFFIESAEAYGAANKVSLLDDTNSRKVQIVELTNPTIAALVEKKGNSFMYKVDVCFKPSIFGKFRQAILFDCGDELKYIRNITVTVEAREDKATDADDATCTTPNLDKIFRPQRNDIWNFGNSDIVDSFTGDKVSFTQLGFASLGEHKVEQNVSLSDPLTLDNYKERMRYFLTQEERSRQEILTKYNLKATLTLTNSYKITSGYNDGLNRYAVEDSLFGRMTLFRDVSEDTAVGRLILRSCNYLLLTKSEARTTPPADENQRPRVYLCPISDKTKNNIFINVGPFCVKELNLRDNEKAMFDIQFQLDRTAFIEMKSVIDRLEGFHLQMLFPDFSIQHNIPWSPFKQWEEDPDPTVKLNPRQKEALIAVTEDAPGIPPVIVVGPFGTGKTYTLAQCIKKLLCKDNIRIMVCTHSNSAADLYIKEYLDPWVNDGLEEARPLRVYYHMRNLNSVHPDVLQYCLVEDLRFRPPTVDEVLAHRIIVVTLSTSYILMQMNLPPGTFSHILLDEAAQAMESEAITPLMCAGPNTTLVLAGDPMQLSPELFSEEARSLHPSLLERLHNYYPDAHPCKLMLCENYRSHSAIIDYVSDAFYNKKLQCSKQQPVHDSYYPLTFFSAQGEEVQDPDSTSYYNMAEVYEVVDKVSQLVSSWPEQWGDYRMDNAIGVLTPYSDQVSRIRNALRKKGLPTVSVERVLNVQGKQFRAVILSTVRGFRLYMKILPDAAGNEVDLGFFSNPKLLNTALTRAQSLVAVVGDPVSLCSEGKCRNLWKDFINVCNKNKSLHGISYSQLEQKIVGLDMRLIYGLNPLADVFEPKKVPNPKKSLPVPYVSSYAEPSSSGAPSAISQPSEPFQLSLDRTEPIPPLPQQYLNSTSPAPAPAPHSNIQQPNWIPPIASNHPTNASYAMQSGPGPVQFARNIAMTYGQQAHAANFGPPHPPQFVFYQNSPQPPPIMVSQNIPAAYLSRGQVPLAQPNAVLRPVRIHHQRPPVPLTLLNHQVGFPTFPTTVTDPRINANPANFQHYNRGGPYPMPPQLTNAQIPEGYGSLPFGSVHSNLRPSLANSHAPAAGIGPSMAQQSLPELLSLYQMLHTFSLTNPSPETANLMTKVREAIVSAQNTSNLRNSNSQGVLRNPFNANTTVPNNAVTSTSIPSLQSITAPVPQNQPSDFITTNHRPSFPPTMPANRTQQINSQGPSTQQVPGSSVSLSPVSSVSLSPRSVFPDLGDAVTSSAAYNRLMAQMSSIAPLRSSADLPTETVRSYANVARQAAGSAHNQRQSNPTPPSSAAAHPVHLVPRSPRSHASAQSQVPPLVLPQSYIQKGKR